MNENRSGYLETLMKFRDSLNLLHNIEYLLKYVGICINIEN